jgi:hypothetical protein
MFMAKINLNLRDLIVHGNFGPIELGISKNDLLAQGLMPEAWFAEKSMEESTCWKYGDFEFYFDVNMKLESIFTDYVVRKFDGGKKIIITDWWLFKKKRITLKKTIKELLSLQINFKKEFIEPGYILISLPNGIRFGFDYMENSKEDQNNWTMTFIEIKAAP